MTEINHNTLLGFGFKVNFENRPQVFYSIVLDDFTQIYYTPSKEQISIYKRYVGNVHQFKNVISMEDISDILKIFVKFK